MALWPAVNFSRQTRPSVLSLKFYRTKVRLQCAMHIVHCARPDAQERVEFCKKVAIWLNRKNEKFHLNFLLLQLEVATWEDTGRTQGGYRDTGTQDTGHSSCHLGGHSWKNFSAQTTLGASSPRIHINVNGGSIVNNTINIIYVMIILK